MKKSDEPVVVIYSGGMDSFTVLNHVLENNYQAFPLTFNYGQKHIKEVDFASKVCRKLDLDHKVIDISSINTLISSSALTSSKKIPEGHYADENMKSTVVPNRNMILLSLAVGYAVSIKATKVFYGAHSGDHAIYPDCREEFVFAMNDVCKIANYEPVEIVTPYINKSKVEILTEGLKMNLDYSDTWTCYNGRSRACGKCGACVERLEAFDLNGVIDPLEYEI